MTNLQFSDAIVVMYHVHDAGIRVSGMLIGVNNRLTCHQIRQQDIPVEQLFVKISFKSYSFILYAVYTSKF